MRNFRDQVLSYAQETLMEARTRVTARSVYPTRLPRSVKPGLWSSVDWPLLACMLTIGLVLLGAVVCLDMITRWSVS